MIHLLPDIRRRQSRGSFLVLMLCMFFFAGCSAYSVIPVTLKEVKDYVVAEEHNFSFRLDQVLPAVITSLQHAGFKLQRVEFFNEKGLVRAGWEERSVLFSLESVTENMSNVQCRVLKQETTRDFSSEKALFADVKKKLETGHIPSWHNLVRNMVSVYMEPNRASTVIAYVAPGSMVESYGKEDGWEKIKLMDGGFGFIDSQE